MSPSRRVRSRIAVCLGLALAVLGCKQGLGERCELDSDCSSGLCTRQGVTTSPASEGRCCADLTSCAGGPTGGAGGDTGLGGSGGGGTGGGGAGGTNATDGSTPDASDAAPATDGSTSDADDASMMSVDGSQDQATD
jgi:hypothetical protein